MQSIWTDVIRQVLLLVIQLSVAGALLWIHRLFPIVQKWMQHHLTVKEREVLQQVGREAFVFAETAYKDLDGTGKLSQALNYASAVADRRGLNVSAAELRAAIEQGWWDAQTSQGDKEKQP